MNRVLVDLNVVLDVLMSRGHHAVPAAHLWTAIEQREVEGLLAAHCVTTLHYLAGRTGGSGFADRCVADVLTVFGVAPVDGAVLRHAANLGWRDFEDAVCAAAAAQAGCQLIATRDPSGFEDTEIPVMDPRAALAAIRAR